MSTPHDDAAAGLFLGESQQFTVESYGCQMNAADSEIVRAVLEGANYQWVDGVDQADVVLLNTCAIRDNAEKRVWGRLASLRGLDKKNGKQRVIGLLGCMAERLKARLLEEAAVDLVAGPDAYRDLPRLLQLVEGGGKAFNVQLSQDETYADIKPVRISPDNVSAFVSIMRGCSNMCAYCIVPFTRGKERSRPVPTIIEEIRRLADQGVKEVVLLGQNVNSFHDKTTMLAEPRQADYEATEGFSNLYRTRHGAGTRFVDLLDQISSQIDPEVRIRFTSPHPKDFPLPLLQIIAERPSLCNALHLPAQSGSSAVLQRMRRGYTRDAYLGLVERAREIIPDVTLSSDFIAGFCGETEEDHQQTLSLMQTVGFDQAFMFAYSLRERTHAAYNLQDDVPEDIKQRRLAEIIATFRGIVTEKCKQEIGKEHLVLVEGNSKRSTAQNPTLTGRTDNNRRCVFPQVEVAAAAAGQGTEGGSSNTGPKINLKPGDYVLVKVVDAKAQTLLCEPLARSSIGEFEHRQEWQRRTDERHLRVEACP